MMNQWDLSYEGGVGELLFAVLVYERDGGRC